MILEGSTFKRGYLTARTVVKVDRAAGMSTAKVLDLCLLNLCQDMAVPVPIWLEKNSRQFKRFGMTSFYPDQFADKVNFDFFQIKWVE